MAVIPIDPNEKITHKDKEGNEYYFRYVTGEYRNKFMTAQNILADVSDKYVKNAEKAIGKNKAKHDQVKKSSLIARKAMELARKDGAITSSMEESSMVGMIDVVLCGWKMKGKKEKIIGVDDRPSNYFTYVSLSEMMLIASTYFNQLLGLEVEDQKN